jgi:hypothetical protein
MNANHWPVDPKGFLTQSCVATAKIRKMDPRIPTILHPLFQEYTHLLEQRLPGRLSALYLEGSLALDGFNPRLGDIDFIAILNSPAAPAEVETLRAVHRSMLQHHPQWELSGRYLQSSDLGRADQDRFLHLNYHDRKLEWANRFGLGSVTWWILKNHGIALFGAPPQDLPFTVDIDALIRTQRENLNTYWASFTTRPSRLLALLTNWGIQWTVLGVLCQFYTIRERKITSKIKAGEYALGCLPEHWHTIIREAISLREQPKHTLYRSKVKRAAEAYRFLQFLLQRCNKYQI